MKRVACFLVFWLLLGCTQNVSEHDCVKNRLFSPTDEILWLPLKANTYTRVSQTDGSTKQERISCNLDVTGIISLGDTKVVCTTNNSIFLGEDKGRKLHIDPLSRCTLGEPIYLTKLDKNKFCTITENERKVSIKCFSLKDAPTLKQNSYGEPPTHVVFHELSTLDFDYPGHLIFASTTRRRGLMLTGCGYDSKLFVVNDEGIIREIRVYDRTEGSRLAMDLTSRRWVDWSANSVWIVEAGSYDVQNTPAKIVIRLLHVREQDESLVVLQECTQELPSDSGFITPVRFISENSFVIASKHGWDMVKFSNHNGDLQMSSVQWKSLALTSSPFIGFWHNRNSNQLFAIQNLGKDGSSMIELKR